MTKVQVKFANVGRGKVSWSDEVTIKGDPDTFNGRVELEGFCLRQVRGKLASRYPEVELAHDGSGIVTAGFHTVGTIAWEVVA